MVDDVEKSVLCNIFKIKIILVAALAVIFCSLQFTTVSIAISPSQIWEDSQNKKQNTFVFKGFYLGMPIEHAQILLNELLGLEQAPTEVADALTDSSLPGFEVGSQHAQAISMLKQMYQADSIEDVNSNQKQKKSFRIYEKGSGFVLIREKEISERPFAYAGPNGKVTEFSISESMRNRLYDTEGWARERFLEKFIANHDVSYMEGEKIQLRANYMGAQIDSAIQGVYRYESEKGFEVVYYADIYWIESGLAVATSYVAPEHLVIRQTKTSEAGNFREENPFDTDPQPESTSPVISIQIGENFYINNEQLGALFVINGNVTNVSYIPQGEIAVKTNMYGADGTVLKSITTYCGNPISRAELRSESWESIQERMSNKLGTGLSNASVQPGESIPFTVVFNDVPESFYEFGLTEVQ